MTELTPRRRVIYVLGIFAAVGLGILWRSGLLPLSDFVSKYGGDAIWALMVYFGMGFLFPRASTLRVAAFALGFAWAIEFLQLYHAPWIDAVRATRVGRLVLGSTFNSPDLVAYAVGVAVGALAEIGFRSAGQKVNREL